MIDKNEAPFFIMETLEVYDRQNEANERIFFMWIRDTRFHLNLHFLNL